MKGGIKRNRGGSIWLSAGFVGFGCCHESMFDTKNLYFYRALLLDWLVGWGKGTVLNQGLGKGEGEGGRGRGKGEGHTWLWGWYMRREGGGVGICVCMKIKGNGETGGDAQTGETLI